MAVFWFGWAKKLKNVLSKKQADSLYLPKTLEPDINELKRLTTSFEPDINELKRLTTSFEPDINELKRLTTSFEPDINELKRLTTLITIKKNSTMPGNGNLVFTFNPQIDNTRPVYIGFEKWDNGSNTLLGAYTIVAIFDNDITYKIYNNIDDVKFYMDNSVLRVGGWNFQSNIVFKNFTIQYIPKTLTTTINEIQEEGE